MPKAVKTFGLEISPAIVIVFFPVIVVVERAVVGLLVPVEILVILLFKMEVSHILEGKAAHVWLVFDLLGGADALFPENTS
jgi:hypothetical protein